MEMKVFSGESGTRRQSWVGTKASVKGARKEEVMLALCVGQSLNVPEAARVGFLLYVLMIQGCGAVRVCCVGCVCFAQPGVGFL